MNADARLKNLKGKLRQVRLKAQQDRQADIDLVLQNMEMLDSPVTSKTLTQRQKSVAEARLLLLKEVESLQDGTMGFFSAAILFERLVKKGEISKDVAENIRIANIRSKPEKPAIVAASTLYRWHSEYNGELASLTPAESWNNALPEWVKPMFELFQTMEKPNLKRTVAELKKMGFSADLNRAKQYIKQVADRVREEKKAC
ncbi:MAG: hypothetical protein JXK94_02080 [Deltaproteobacteria bacterium]|nr:hypothetical protein [Deltaproteobacteria bacterium]